MSDEPNPWLRAFDARCRNDPDWIGGLQLIFPQREDPLRKPEIVDELGELYMSITRSHRPHESTSGYNESFITIAGSIAGWSASQAVWKMFVVEQQRHPVEVYAFRWNRAGVEFWLSDAVGRLITGGSHGWASLWLGVQSILVMNGRTGDAHFLRQVFADVARLFRSDGASPFVSTAQTRANLMPPWIGVRTAIEIGAPLAAERIYPRTEGDDLKLHARCVDAAVTAAMAAVEAGMDPENAAYLLLQSAAIGTRIPLEPGTAFSKSAGLS